MRCTFEALLNNCFNQTYSRCNALSTFTHLDIDTAAFSSGLAFVMCPMSSPFVVVMLPMYDSSTATDAFRWASTSLAPSKSTIAVSARHPQFTDSRAARHFLHTVKQLSHVPEQDVVSAKQEGCASSVAPDDMLTATASACHGLRRASSVCPLQIAAMTHNRRWYQ